MARHRILLVVAAFLLASLMIPTAHAAGVSLMYEVDWCYGQTTSYTEAAWPSAVVTQTATFWNRTTTITTEVVTPFGPTQKASCVADGPTTLLRVGYTAQDGSNMGSAWRPACGYLFISEEVTPGTSQPMGVALANNSPNTLYLTDPFGVVSTLAPNGYYSQSLGIAGNMKVSTAASGKPYCFEAWWSLPPTTTTQIQ